MQDMLMKKKWYVVVDTETLSVSLKKMCVNDANHLSQIETYQVFDFDSKEDAERFYRMRVIDCFDVQDNKNINVTINMCGNNELEQKKKFGSGKEDLCLLSAVTLFLVNYCPETEHDLEHMWQLINVSKTPKKQKYPQSDLDKIFEQIKIIDPHGLTIQVYDFYKEMKNEKQINDKSNMFLKDLLDKIKKDGKTETTGRWMRGDINNNSNSMNKKKRKGAEDEFFF